MIKTLCSKVGVIYICLLILGFSFSFVSYTYAEKLPSEANVYRITFSDGDDVHPKVYGNKIVWSRTINDHRYMCLYNLATGVEKIIKEESYKIGLCDIYDEKIVWCVEIDGTWDIYLYDEVTKLTKKIIDNPKNQTSPVIFRDYIAWCDDRGGGWDIYMYDMQRNMEKKISDSHCGYEFGLSIYEDKIVWQDNRTGIWQIYLYNISAETETQITYAFSDKDFPTIYENIVVWQDSRNSLEPLNPNNRDYRTDIYMYDLITKEERLLVKGNKQAILPYIWGDKVVYSDTKNDFGDIYLYNISSNIVMPICISPGWQICPSIYGNKIVWQDNRNGNWDIYLYTNESVNVPTQNQQDNQNILGLLEQYRYILITIIVAVAILIPFIYYRIKMMKLKHEK